MFIYSLKKTEGDSPRKSAARSEYFQAIKQMSPLHSQYNQHILRMRIRTDKSYEEELMPLFPVTRKKFFAGMTDRAESRRLDKLEISSTASQQKFNAINIEQRQLPIQQISKIFLRSLAESYQQMTPLTLENNTKRLNEVSQESSPTNASQLYFGSRTTRNNQNLEKTPQKYKSQVNLRRQPHNNFQISTTKILAIDRNQTFEGKLNLYLDFMQVINLSNDIIVSQPNREFFVPYKANITKANNGTIVRACLRQRWWWGFADKDDQYEKTHLVWSSWRKPRMIKLLKPSSNTRPKDSPLNQLLNKTDLSQIRLNKQIHVKSLKKLLNEEQQNTVLEKLSNRSQVHVNGPFLFTDDKSHSLVTMNLQDQLDLQHFKSNRDWKLHNHLERNSQLHSKKYLLSNLKRYYEKLKLDPFDYIPITFHIQNGLNDKEFQNFRDTYKKLKGVPESSSVIGSVWIVKPGENSNRGMGIQVYSKFNDISSAINQKEFHANGRRFTYIIQKYIEKPLLFNKRKFDIRCYVLVTSVNGRIKAYWYSEAYIRTSSKEFSLKNLDNRLIHLTNDAVQKKSEEYGKFEFGNKVNLEDFQTYLDAQNQKINFVNDLFPQMKKIATDSISAVFHKIDPYKRTNTFELFGLDFMLDENFKPWLIEFNANPCLETTCMVLTKIILPLIENVWRIAIDPLYPPPPVHIWPKNKRHQVPEAPYSSNKFELIFDEFYDGPALQKLLNLEEDLKYEPSDDDMCDDE